MNRPSTKTLASIAGAAITLAGTLTGLAVTNTGVFSKCVAPHNVAAIGMRQLACPAPVSTLGVSVSGNQLMSNGARFVPYGVNRSGTEYRCVQGPSSSFFDGPSDDASVTAIASWKVNTVRMGLNEDCWLGINGAPNNSNGGFVATAATYQQAIKDYVTLLNAHGIRVILELHWAAPGTNLANKQEAMADADHTPAFWTSVANTFKANTSVMFDLYNEPYLYVPGTSNPDWACWLNGCQTSIALNGGYGTWQTAGMQQLLDAVRATGATNIALASGDFYAGDITLWLNNKPVDPLNQLVASWHTYGSSTPCPDVTCRTNNILPTSQTVPLIIGEIGPPFNNGNDSAYPNEITAWADSYGIGYLAWTWDNFGAGTCSGETLISNYDGTPCGLYGQFYHDHLIAGPPPPPPPTTTTTAPSGSTTTAPAGSAFLSISPPQVPSDWNNPTNNFGFNTIVLDPGNPAVLYLGTNYHGLWRSINSGSTWTKINTGANASFLDSGRLWSLAIDPQSPVVGGMHQIIWAVSGYGQGGPLKSSDGGVSWVQLPAGGITQYNDVYAVVPDPYLANHILLTWHSVWTTGSSGVSQSYDGGATWTELTPATTAWGQAGGGTVAFLNNSNTWIFGDQGAGEWLTTNAGGSWTQLTSGGNPLPSMDHGAIYSLTGPVSGHYYLTLQSQVFESVNNGVTWTNISTGLPGNGSHYETVITDGTYIYTSWSFPTDCSTFDTPCTGYFWYQRLISGGSWSQVGTQKSCYSDPFNARVLCNGPVQGAFDATNHIAYSANWDGGVWKHQG